MALVHPEKVKDLKVLREIEQLTRGYRREDYFVEQLAQGVSTIAAAFYPKPVVVRMSDFKTNEYASLLGGSYFEMDESNPMSLVKTSIPLYPMNLWILLEKRKVYRQRMKVNMIDMRIIIFCSIFSVLPIRTITVLIAPGPVRRGRPIGNTQISSRSWDCEISSSVMLSLEILAWNPLQIQRFFSRSVSIFL